MTTLLNTGITSREELVTAVVSSTPCVTCFAGVGQSCVKVIANSQWVYGVMHYDRLSSWMDSQDQAPAAQPEERRQMINPETTTLIEYSVVWRIPSPSPARDVQDTLTQIKNHLKNANIEIYDDTIMLRCADDELHFVVKLGTEKRLGIDTSLAPLSKSV